MRPLPILALMTLAVVTAACAGGSSSGTPSVSAVASASPTGVASPTPEVEAFLALCSSAASVAAGDLVGAGTTFHDEVHETLHELAEDVEAVDRAVSAALLQAKSRVEADLEAERPDAGMLGSDLEALIGAMTNAMAAVQIAAPPCTGEVP